MASGYDQEKFCMSFAVEVKENAKRLVFKGESDNW